MAHRSSMDPEQLLRRRVRPLRRRVVVRLVRIETPNDDGFPASVRQLVNIGERVSVRPVSFVWIAGFPFLDRNHSNVVGHAHASHFYLSAIQLDAYSCGMLGEQARSVFLFPV